MTVSAPVELRNAALEATIVPALACVCTSLRHDGQELLWLRAEVDEYARGALTGIPLLHPWANRLAGVISPETPATERDEHGFALHGLQAWALPFVVTGSGEDWLTASLSVSPELAAVFPYDHSLEVSFRLGAGGLTVTTTLVASGADGVPAAFGWHPFFVMPGAPRADWHVELPLGRRLELDERMLPTSESSDPGALDGPLAQRRFDDLFGAVRGPLAVEGGGRRVEMVMDGGYDYAQVWALPEYDVVSFEPMTAPANALASGRGLRVLEPGESLSASFRGEATRR